MPPLLFSRYIVDWLATQTMTRAQQMVVEEVKSRVESGDLGDYEGVLFKDSFKGGSVKAGTFSGGVDLGVVAASKKAIVGLLDKMGTPKVTKGNAFTYYVGTWKGRRIAIVQTGKGLEAARRGTEALLQTFRPARVASIGFARSVDPSLKRQTLFMPDRLISEKGETVDLRSRLTAVSCDKPTPEPSKDEQTGATQESVDVASFDPTKSAGEKQTSERSKAVEKRLEELTSGFRTGALLSLEEGKPNAEQKVGVAAYDHATWAVADVCARENVPFLSLRVIYDLKSQKVSREAAKVVTSNQSFARSLGAFLGATMKKPSAVVDVYKVKEEELAASDKLANATCRILSAFEISDQH